MKRTLVLEAVDQISKPILLKGWVNARRDHGKIVFLDLRDRSGLIQVVCTKDQAGQLRSEWLVAVEGQVKPRMKGTENPDMKTGSIEIEAKNIKVISQSETPPFEIDADGRDINELTRLKYRYLDLRRPRLTHNLRLRSQFVNQIRQYLFDQDFTEIETPMLTKSTPEGARDFLVPSRLQPGKFYALPQSPQQYKQLLMVAGFERYFQMARCLRDEDLRADRGFEHTQIDIEMSFVKQRDVMNLVEDMLTKIVKNLGGKLLKNPFPVYTYQQAMKEFGADKFDLRTDKQKEAGVLAFTWVIDFPFFEKTKEGNWTFTHNPFSAPISKHQEKLLKGEIEGILTSQYDLVCNGYEVGGGSIRSHDPQVLTQVFKVLGYSKDQIKAQFGHMLEAFKYGVPPHGGIACGVERLISVLTGEESIKEVVAFPMTSGGQIAVMDAPSVVDKTQLDELGLKLK